MNKIVVWLKEDYSEANEFFTESNTKLLIDKEVYERYPIWYYYDIWPFKDENIL
jgi:hypothetical protein